jgi:hypothetical protein
MSADAETDERSFAVLQRSGPRTEAEFRYDTARLRVLREE